MNYLRADIILPEELLTKLQEYVQDGLLYIPKPKNLHKKWGEISGSREFIKHRNKEIKDKFQNSNTIEELAQEYFLSIETIKRIVYTK